MLVLQRPYIAANNSDCCSPAQIARRNMAHPNYRPAYHLSSFVPKIEVMEDSTKYYLEIELAGLNRDDFSLTVNDEKIMIIKGEKKFDRKDESEKIWRKERAYGKFERKFQLPKNVDDNKIDASYENGVLSVTLPKIEPSLKEITIEG